MSESIKEFIEWYSKGKFKLWKNFDDNYYLDEIKAALCSFKGEKKRDYIGASSLGKPLIQLALKKLGFPYADGHDIVNKTMLTFHFGHVFEAFVISLMKSQGLKVSDEQRSVVYTPHYKSTYKGHIDGVVNDETLLEVKTMSGHYFSSFTKRPNNQRGYITQLGFYWHGLDYLKLKNCGWLCFNKETFDIDWVEPDNESLENEQMVINNKINQLENVNTVIDLFNVPLPSLKPEVYKKQETGKFLLPITFRNNLYCDCFFNTYDDKDGYGKTKTYVDTDNRPDESEVLDRLLNKKAQFEVQLLTEKNRDN